MIGAIYDASYTPDRWPQLLEQFTQWLGSPSGHLSIIRNDLPELSMVYEHNIHPDFAPFYEHRIDEDPWFQGARNLQTGDLFVDEELCDLRNYHRSDYYNEVAAPYGIDHCAGGVILRNERLNIVVTGNSSADHKGFNGQTKEQIELILPHFKRAFEIYYRLTDMQNDVSSLQQGLDFHHKPIVLLDIYGSVCYCNAAFEKLLRSQDSFKLRQRKLCVGQPDEQRKLEQIISTVLASVDNPHLLPEAGMSVHIPERPSPVSILLSPLRSNESISKIHSQARLILMVPDYFTPVLPTIELLMSVHGLSYNQSRLARCLLANMPVKEAAQSLGIKYQTARSYLKEILLRTNTHSQPDLIIKLSQLIH